MSINSRLRNIQKSLQFREVAMLWLKTLQARGPYSEYWKIGEFQPWVSENEEAGLLYHLVFEVNGAVITAAQGWRVLSGWASLLGISMIESTTPPDHFHSGKVVDIVDLWRQKLCNFLVDVVALEQAVHLISEGISTNAMSFSPMLRKSWRLHTKGQTFWFSASIVSQRNMVKNPST